MTHRQFETWLAWLRLDFSRETPVIKYLQLVAAEGRKGWVAKPNEVQPDHMRLEFQDKPIEKSKPADDAILASFAKAKWLVAVGLKKQPKVERRERRDN